MSDANERLSHADRHDLDKLVRWKTGLDTAAKGEATDFPVCAIFLVSPEDRASHDIFRQYRSAFEELGGGFHHLVIFGQHGVSATQEAFLSEVEMEQASVPLLVIAPIDWDRADDARVFCLDLPKGDRADEPDASQSWGTVLGRVRVAMAEDSPLALDRVEGIKAGLFRRGPLPETVAAVQSDLGGVGSGFPLSRE